MTHTHISNYLKFEGEGGGKKKSWAHKRLNKA